MLFEQADFLVVAEALATVVKTLWVEDELQTTFYLVVPNLGHLYSQCSMVGLLFAKGTQWICGGFEEGKTSSRLLIAL